MQTTLTKKYQTQYFTAFKKNTILTPQEAVKKYSLDSREKSTKNITEEIDSIAYSL